MCSSVNCNEPFLVIANIYKKHKKLNWSNKNKLTYADQRHTTLDRSAHKRYPQNPTRGRKKYKNSYSSPIVEINSLPVRIVSGVKSAAIGIEFIREHQNKLFAWGVGFHGHGRSWSFEVDETVVSCDIGHLTRGVGSSKVETTLVCLLCATQEMS